MNHLLRFAACLALFGSTAALIGCGSSEARSPVAVVDQHDHDHDHDHDHESHGDSHGHTTSKSLADMVVKVEKLSSTIQEAFTSGDIEKGHGPLHEIGHLLEALPEIAAKESLGSGQQEQLKEAVDSLMDSFGTLDERLHGSGDDGKSIDEVAAQIEVAMFKLKAVCEGEGFAMNTQGTEAIRLRHGWQMIGRISACVTLLLLLAGCTTEDPQFDAMRSRLLLNKAPTNAMSIADAKSAVSENPNIAVIAQIVPDEHEAFMLGQAAFVVTEVLSEEDGHGGKQHADNCPFCKRKAAEAPRAAVQFVDESGSPLKVDARELFGVRCGDEVVIRGQGELLAELNLFQVTADGVYLRNRRSE